MCVPVSADNWTDCPRCTAKHLAEREAFEKKVEASYGVLPVDKFDAMRRELETTRAPDPSLREDYEIGISQGKFSASYSGRCDMCGFKFSFTHEQKIEEPTP